MPRSTPSTGRRPRTRPPTWRCSSWLPRALIIWPTRRVARPISILSTPTGQARQGRVRRELRRLPLQQDPAVPANSGIDDGICAGGGNGPNYRACWDRYWEWTQTRAFKDAMIKLVTRPRRKGQGYLPRRQLTCRPNGGYRSTYADQRLHPARDQRSRGRHLGQFHLVVLQVVCRRSRSSPSTIRSRAARCRCSPLGNGRGYLRPPSLISLWSTAPSCPTTRSVMTMRAIYPRATAHPSQAGRTATPPALRSTLPRRERRRPLPALRRQPDEGVQPLDPPDAQPRRRGAPIVSPRSPVPGYIYRTTAPSCLMVPAGYMPSWLRACPALHWLAPWAIDGRAASRSDRCRRTSRSTPLTNTKLLPDNDEPGNAGPLLEAAEGGRRPCSTLLRDGRHLLARGSSPTREPRSRPRRRCAIPA